MSVAEALYFYTKTRARRDQYVYLHRPKNPQNATMERLEREVEAADRAVDAAIRKLLQGVLDEQRGM